jgi:hypothetical protein
VTLLACSLLRDNRIPLLVIGSYLEMILKLWFDNDSAT